MTDFLTPLPSISMPPQVGSEWAVKYPDWFQLVAWLQGPIFRICQAGQQANTTANRPTTGLWVGRIFFDTTLTKPIWVKQVSPAVWVDATGTVV
jgi:hypothetical protein